jgi:hypothetical protein
MNTNTTKQSFTTSISDDQEMDVSSDTPFPSPVLPSSTPQPRGVLNPITEAVQNAGTPFFALRRMLSYRTEIAPAVSTLFDMLPMQLAWYMDNDNPRYKLRQHIEHEILMHTAHDYLACNAESIDNSCHLIATLRPVFEQVYILRRTLEACDGRLARMRNGIYISHSHSIYPWKISGVHISPLSRIVIYKAHSYFCSYSIYIAVPMSISQEGIEYSTRYGYP